MHRENSVRHLRKNSDQNKAVDGADKASNIVDAPRQRGFINFSAAKERQRTQQAAGRARWELPVALSFGCKDFFLALLAVTVSDYTRWVRSTSQASVQCSWQCRRLISSTSKFLKVLRLRSEELLPLPYSPNSLLMQKQWGCITCKHTARWLYLSRMKKASFSSS